MENQNEQLKNDAERDKHINTGVVPEDQIKGSDADTNPELDISNSPDTKSDERDASGVGSQENDVEDMDIDESTGGSAM
ncbi:hypothetical protein [Pedobacter deserti]|uniref:hypothetical protein n=1 Tax=Pedobacter deserti TaxID=2817382 RepID=UPI00210BC0DD|nr:hypothetical protein [Pedobacter sp. SYSU D00382]